MRTVHLLVATVAAKECWVDDDTPASAYSTLSPDKKKFDLIFSDEFNAAGRKFANGQDSKWTALNVGDTSNQGSAFYVPEQATISKDAKHPDVSALLITTVNASHSGVSPLGEPISMPYKSAMLQSWNKFCFTGGIVEFRARMPRGAGYWPALWLFGNLGRAVYQNSNTGLWPWSYDECDADLVLPPYDPPQRISACDDQDPNDGLNPFQGRGATELDVLEGAVTNTGTHSYVVGSLQLSPGIPAYFKPPLFSFPTASGPGQWYSGLSFGQIGKPNSGWYGPPFGTPCPTGCPDALSGGITERDDLDTKYWTYRMVWKLGDHGELGWYYDGNFAWGMSAESFGEYTVCGDRVDEKECVRTPKRQIPAEPMSLVMNTAIGTWNGGKSALDGKHWPALFYVDYVRVWQDPDEKNVGCDPPNFPTAKYIEKNADFYGEPVAPLGTDTCPESYPASAHAHAAQLQARAAETRAAARQAKLLKAQGFAAATSVLQQQPQLQPAAEAPAARASLWPTLGAVGAVLALALAAAAAVLPGRLRSHRGLPDTDERLEGFYQLAE